jgi:predicted transcriptional regulator
LNELFLNPSTDSTSTDFMPETEQEHWAKGPKVMGISPESIKISGSITALPIKKGSIKHISPRRGVFKVVIRKVERPYTNDFEQQLAWICSSLGFFEPIDKEKNAAAVFKEIVSATEKGEALSSTAIAQRIGMSRGSTINHLNRLLKSGLIEKNGTFYSSRSSSLERTIEEIEGDVNRIFEQLKKSATEIDRQFGFE